MDNNEIFNTTLSTYSTLIWSMCRDAACGDSELCRDLFQEVSIRLWLHISELDMNAKPYQQKAWVEWQVRHVLSHSRKPREMEHYLPEHPDSDAAAEAELRTLVADLMAQLQDEDRQLMQMRLEGYSADEIAQATGLKRDAVYQRIHRIMARMRKMLIALLCILAASAIAVAVVPQWRKAVFHRSTPPPSPASKGVQPHLQPTSDSAPTPEIVVNWDYHGNDPWYTHTSTGGSGFAFNHLDSTITYYRTLNGRTVTAVMHVDPALLSHDTLTSDSMNTTMKQAALAAALVALATATHAQVAHDFQTVTPQGDTLFCTITDSTQHHISVRGDESVWNAHYIHYSDTLVIPATVEHDGTAYTVTALADSAFYSHGEVRSVSIPATITTIGRLALSYTLINDLFVHDGVETIGEKAFGSIKNVVYHGTATGSPWGALTVNAYVEDSLYYTDSTRTRLTACHPQLTQAIVPPSVRTIGRLAFAGSNTLTTVTLPEGLDTIGNYAFQSCSQLGSVSIPSTVRAIGNYAFYNAFRQDGSATATIADAEHVSPDSGCSIGKGAFAYSHVGAVSLGNRITSIGSDAFSTCDRLDSVIVPNSCTYLAERVFCYNYNGRLKKVHLPEGLDSIRAELLHGCPGLKEVNIPSSVVYIDSMAFLECSKLTELTLPEGLTYIGQYAFGECSRVRKIRSLAATPPQAFSGTFERMNPELSLIVPCHSGEAYNADPYWSYFNNIEEDCTGAPTAEAPQVAIRTIEGGITLEGCTDDRIRIFDTGGRLIAETTCHGTCTIRLPVAGIYMVQIADRPARKVVVQ
ncbi:MAG: sigma-70 family RNA polymerase sigma factor [Bacteroidales bacterium]|nr:sigma-70 family RNA polymerase sigma factor [Bacteroidales bacterium]